jgi:hypothetical protein
MTTNPIRQVQPNPDLRSLYRLVGRWQASGDATGQVRHEWTPGGFFLMQHFDLIHDGRGIQGIEVIWHRHPFGGGVRRLDHAGSLKPDRHLLQLVQH